MAAFYLKPTADDAVRLNSILYFRYVTEDGENYKFPFDSSTTEFIKYFDTVFIVGERTISAPIDNQIAPDDRNFISALLMFKKTEAEALAAEWITR